ncbi:hypothetical protein [Candidatus Uabimicrobium sp. HlEnr_7]|uniref:hypothetical protein n=1 Tax=Candidatus Uabimicrobium helgolandensis TaxID=3095367 RepID=UPI0035562238
MKFVRTIIKNRQRITIYLHLFFAVEFVLWVHYDIYNQYKWLILPIWFLTVVIGDWLLVFSFVILPLISLLFCSTQKTFGYSFLGHLVLSFIQCKALVILLS